MGIAIWRTTMHACEVKDATYGMDLEITFIPNACMRTATSRPILPRPIMARVFPLTSFPRRRFFLFHSLDRTNWVPRATFLELQP